MVLDQVLRNSEHCRKWNHQKEKMMLHLSCNATSTFKVYTIILETYIKYLKFAKGKCFILMDRQTSDRICYHQEIFY